MSPLRDAVAYAVLLLFKKAAVNQPEVCEQQAGDPTGQFGGDRRPTLSTGIHVNP